MVFVNYLANAKPKLQKLYPPELKTQIRAHLTWFGAVLRPCVKRLTSMLVGPNAFGHPRQSESDIEEELTFFHDTLLPKMNEMLESGPFFCGSATLTVVDIVFYSELLTIIVITGRKVNRQTAG